MAVSCAASRGVVVVVIVDSFVRARAEVAWWSGGAEPVMAVDATAVSGWLPRIDGG